VGHTDVTSSMSAFLRWRARLLKVGIGLRTFRDITKVLDLEKIRFCLANRTKRSDERMVIGPEGVGIVWMTSGRLLPIPKTNYVDKLRRQSEERGTSLRASSCGYHKSCLITYKGGAVNVLHYS